MRRFNKACLLFCACLVSSIFQARTSDAATVIWPITDAAGTPMPYCQVVVKPTGPFTNGAGGFTLNNSLYQFNADSNSVSTMTNLAVGTYIATAGKLTPIQFSVTNAVGTYNIASLGPVVIQPSTATAFSMAASDAQYVKVTSPPSIIAGSGLSGSTNGAVVTLTATGGGGGTLFASTNIPLTNEFFTVQHGLGATPSWVRVVVVCVTNDSNMGTSVGQEWDADAWFNQGGGTWVFGADATNCYCSLPGVPVGNEINYVLKIPFSEGNESPSDFNHFRLKFYARP